MGHEKRILLIDDDIDHLLICNLILRRRGYEVLTLAGCEKMDELVKAVETFLPDLIFLEHDMRGICGMDLARMLKSHDSFKSIPVIYFSGRDDIVRLAKQAGADNYLRKPLDVNMFTNIALRYAALS
jgi:two-component system cell cycle response regulator DivK